MSEMFCLEFPSEYPVLNEPVQTYLRASLIQNPDHPAKNLAELDRVFWLEYEKARTEA